MTFCMYHSNPPHSTVGWFPYFRYYVPKMYFVFLINDGKTLRHLFLCFSTFISHSRMAGVPSFLYKVLKKVLSV